jgi:hypothetical protein
MTEPHAHIKELERQLARGDIASASQTITAIHDRWSEFTAADQNDITTLEAIYLSLVGLRGDDALRKKKPPHKAGVLLS